MIRRQPYLGIGYLLAVLVEAAGVYGAIILLWGQSARSPQVTVGGQWRLLAIIYGLLLLGTAVHELGHLLAAWMLGEKVTEVHIGSPPSVLRVRAVGVVWHLGLVPRAGSGTEAERQCPIGATPCSERRARWLTC